mmetsp:Transcript_14370/g.20990  ORF Transcript_14370/g.20990 Transcript_14370/m.20990 type:complete len:247 (-) Transcript_14370:2270-3010(-)
MKSLHKLLLVVLGLLEAEARAGGGGSGGSSGGGTSGGSRSSTTSGGSLSGTGLAIFLGIFGGIIVAVGTFVYCNLYYKPRKHRQKVFKLKEHAKEKLEKLKGDFWDENSLKETASSYFHELQTAWSENDLDLIGQKLTQQLYYQWKVQLDKMESFGEANSVSDLHIKELSIVKVKDASRDIDDTGFSESYFVTLINAYATDLILAKNTGRVKKDQSGFFEEFWKFIWTGDKWLLSKIYQYGDLSFD